MLKKNHHLKSIMKHEGKYVLTFQPTETVNGVTRDITVGHYLVMSAYYTELNDLRLIICLRKLLLKLLLKEPAFAAMHGPHSLAVRTMHSCNSW